MKIIFATNNKNKVEEIKHLSHQKFEIFTLQEMGIDIDIPEPHDTLEANATEKSSTIYKLTNEAVFSEDTGLEVEALGGAPGVKSARYAGEGRNMQDNIDKLLAEYGFSFQFPFILVARAKYRLLFSLSLLYV